jgi:iron complex outermembrane receptor protein
MASVSLNKNDKLDGIDRSWASGYQPDKYLIPDNSSSPGFANILTGAGTALGTGSTVGPTDKTNYTVINAMALNGNCGAMPFGVGQVPNITIFPGYSAATSTYRCGTDYGRQYMLSAPTKNASGVLRGTVALGADATGFVEFIGSHVKTGGEYTPAQFTSSQAANGAANYPVSGPYYAAAAAALAAGGVNNFNNTLPIAYRLRMNDWGNRSIENRSDNRRFAAGVEGSFGDFDYKASISHGEATGSTTLVNGFADTNKLIAMLGTGVYNPFLMPGQTQTAAAMAAVEATQVRGQIQAGSTKVDAAQASISGKLATLPAGEMDFAVGVDLRREAYDFSGTQGGITCVSTITAANAAQSNSTLLCSGNASAPNSSRKVGAAYGELQVPIAKGFDVQLALRHDQYQQIGGTTNPKIAFKLTPTKDLLFRGSMSTGFRAPTAQQLNLGTIQQVTGTFSDPVKCPAGTDQADPNCALSSLPQFVGGNPNLKPETSRQSSLGVVFSPIGGVTASLDYWQIRMKDRIHNLTLTDELNNYEQFSGNFTRDASGNITSVQSGWINAGASDTKGLDFVLTHAMKLLGGKLDSTLTATKMISDKEASLPGQAMVQYVGTFGTSNYTLYQKWKANVSSTFKTQNWATTATVNYSSGYQDEARSNFAGVIGPLTRDV